MRTCTRTITPKSVGLLIPLLGCLAAGAVAFAAVVIDEEGLGFVGKGDVQQVFGWNNAQLQANAHLAHFRVSETQEASWECEWWTRPQPRAPFHHKARKGKAE